LVAIPTSVWLKVTHRLSTARRFFLPEGFIGIISRINPDTPELADAVVDRAALVVVNTDVAPVMVADIELLLDPDCVVEKKALLLVEEADPEDNDEVCPLLVVETARDVDVEDLVGTSIGPLVDETLVVEVEVGVCVLSDEVLEDLSVVGGGVEVEVEVVCDVGIGAQLEVVGALGRSLLLLVIQSPQLGGVDRRRDLDTVNQM
jgi:hypothetical protein